MNEMYSNCQGNGKLNVLSSSKCSNLEAIRLYPSNFAIKEIKGRTIISHKQNLKNKVKIKEELKLKTKLTETKI